MTSGIYSDARMSHSCGVRIVHDGISASLPKLTAHDYKQGGALTICGQCEIMAAMELGLIATAYTS